MIKIRKFQKKDLNEVSSLLIRTYAKFNSKEYFEKKSVKNYMNNYDFRKNSEIELLKRFSKTPIFYIAYCDKKIVGMVRGTSDKLINLFVDGRYHGKGIGKLLMKKFEKEATKHSKEICLKASLYATSFYQKMGYKKTTGIRNFRGLKVQPMRKLFK